MLPVPPEGIRHIFFPGTRLRHENGGFLIPYMFTKGGRWDVYIFWLDFEYSDKTACLIRSVQAAS